MIQGVIWFERKEIRVIWFGRKESSTDSHVGYGPVRLEEF